MMGDERKTSLDVMELTEPRFSFNDGECWGRDRLLLSNFTQNLLIAMRTNGRFSARSRSFNSERVGEHLLLCQLRSLQQRLMVPSDVRHISEEEILQPFCAVCSSGTVSSTIVGVALLSLSNIVDFRCSFITEQGLEKVLDSIYDMESEEEDISAYEVVLARSLQLLVSCVAHPSARVVHERVYVKAVQRAYTLAVHPDATPLLRRTAEQAMKAIVSSLYAFVAERKPSSSEQGLSDEVETAFFFTGVDMLHYLCNLIKGVECEGCVEAKGDQADKVRMSSSVAAVQLEGLLMVQTMLFVVGDSLCEPRLEKLLHAVKHKLCRALLVAGVSTDNLMVFSQILRTVHIVAEFVSTHVVPHLFYFIKALHLDSIIRITEDLSSGVHSRGRGTYSSPIGAVTASFSTGSLPHMSMSEILELYERRELLLESLVEFCGNMKFATFCYAHYDLSLWFSSLLTRLCTLLVENCFYMTDKELLSVPRKGNGGDKLITEFGAEGFMWQTGLLALEAISNLLQQIVVPITQLSSPPQTLVARIEAQLVQKRLLMEFASRFRNDAVKVGIPFLLQNAIRVPEGSFRQAVSARNGKDIPALVIAEPAGGREVGACLFHLSHLLDKRVLGEYLGELGKEFPAEETIVGTAEEKDAALARWEAERKKDYLRVGTVAFFSEQLRGFLGEFDFSNKSLLSCIRETAYRMCMPGEAQKIDRVMEAFSTEWLNANRNAEKDINPFSSKHGPFVIAFSLIMLNTDLHSGKMTKCMTQAEFRRMHRDSDGGNSLPEEFLDGLYNDVKAHQIIMAEMINVGFANDVTWALEMRDYAIFDDLRCSLQATALVETDRYVAEALNPFIFSALWSHFVRAFSNTLETCSSFLDHHVVKERAAQENGFDGVFAMTTAERAYNRAFDGLALLAKTAGRLGISSAVDQVIMVFLSQLSPNMQDAYRSLVRLGTQRPYLRCMETFFSVLCECMPMVQDSWEALGRFFSKYFLLGMFAKESTIMSNSSFSTSSFSAEVPEVWDELCCDPGILELGDTRRVSSEGGWLAALWGFSISSERTKAQEEREGRLAVERVKALFPSMEDFMRMIGALEKRAYQMFFSALCESGTVSADNAVESCAASYTIIFVTEVLSRRLEDDVLRSSYINLCKQATSNIFAILDHLNGARLKTSIKKSRSFADDDNCSAAVITKHPVGSDDYNYWLSVGTRVVRAVIRGAKHFLYSALYYEVGLQLIAILTAAPSSVFAIVVASELSGALFEFVTKPHFLSQDLPSSLLYGLLAAFRDAATKCCGQTLLLWRIREALAVLVRQGRYDTLRDGEHIVYALVACALGSLNNEDEENLGRVEALCDVSHNKPPESFADIIGILSHRLVTCHASETTFNECAEWCRAWFASLSGLCALVVYLRQGRDQGEALLCLQRCMLNSEIKQLPVVVIESLYEEAIFPLTEQLCAPCTTVFAPTKINGLSEDSNSDNLPSKTFLSSFFSSFAVPLLQQQRQQETLERCAMEGAAMQQSAVKEKKRNAVNNDLRCRVVGLLPKGFLHYSTFLEKTPEKLQRLWQRILGTLYALYTASTSCASNGVVCESYSGKGMESRASFATEEEEASFREAIEEAVKNMILVFSTTFTGPESRQILEKTPYFWTSTKNLLRTFDFAEPLLVHIDALES